MKDIFGKALADYYNGERSEKLYTETSISEKEEFPVSHLFRDYENMPEIEKKALSEARGQVLDIGCGAGSHALYLQNIRKIEVTALDQSARATEICKMRGVKNIITREFKDFHNKKFDTLLLLMNGTGICGTYKNLSAFLKHLKSLLHKNGQILIDSSDIIYMYDQDKNGSYYIPAQMDYYGELEFVLTYKGETELPFSWLYLDFNTLQKASNYEGFRCEMLTKGEHFDYLAKLTFW
ncbi:class I SAM-dependent methyltransferase [Ascidiimonas aurantiaca]|uniref:class I SAM-dependent methyltransferase n=1 Tax=Ascidiimonas aurantiaca TaxID=1685432 RepID=UPI0030EEE65F